MTRTIEISHTCRVLATETHRHCAGCDCTCHERGSFGGQASVRGRRPHSFPREDWAHGKRPKWWRDDKTARKREEKLLGLI
jgi:hypothetical protein